MAILTSTVNAQVYVEILDTFLIPYMEKKFGDDVIFRMIMHLATEQRVLKLFFRKGISTHGHQNGQQTVWISIRLKIYGGN